MVPDRDRVLRFGRGAVDRRLTRVVGAWDQDVSRDRDPKFEEIGEANEVLERDAMRTVFDERPVRLGLGGLDRRRQANPSAQARDPGDVFEEKFRLDPGGFNTRCGKPGRGAAQQVGCGFSGALHADPASLRGTVTEDKLSLAAGARCGRDSSAWMD